MLWGAIVSGIDSLIFEALLTTTCHSTALSMSIYFPGSAVNITQPEPRGQPGDTCPATQTKILPIFRYRKVQPTDQSPEGNMKIDSLNSLKKSCPKGTWVFLSAKFLPPGFQLWSWPQGHQIHPYSAWSLLRTLSSFPSAPLLLTLALLLSPHTQHRIISQFCSGCHSKDKPPKPYSLFHVSTS